MDDKKSYGYDNRPGGDDEKKHTDIQRGDAIKRGKESNMKFKIAKQYIAHAKETPFRFHVFDDNGGGDGGDNGGGSQGGDNGGGAGDDGDGDKGGDDKGEKKYTDAEVNALLDKKFAQWQKRQQKAVDEAKKLEQMSAEEKTAQKLAEMQKRLDDMEKKEAHSKMAASARKLLQGESIVVDDVIINALIREDAEQTKAAVDAFVASFKTAVQNAAKATFARPGKPKTGGAGGTTTRADIMKITDRAERQKAIKAHPELFK